MERNLDEEELVEISINNGGCCLLIHLVAAAVACIWTCVHLPLIWISIHIYSA